MSRNVKHKMGQRMIRLTCLFFMLAITTYALVMSFVEVNDHRFMTGTVDIELNDGKPIFNADDKLLEPNAQIVKTFMIENMGSADVYYRLYIDQLDGGLKDALIFEIYEGENLLFSGSSANLESKTACVSHQPLVVGESRELKALVYMKKESGNQMQGQKLTFDLYADAVQVKNNPDEKFE